MNLSEIRMSLSVLQEYENAFGEMAPKESYATPEEAEARARELGGQGFHSHTQEDGGIIYMPFSTHAEYESAIGFERDPLDEEFKQTMRDKIRQRMLQLVEASTTNNGF